MEPVQMSSALQEELQQPANYPTADSLSQWMFERVKSYIKGKVLETNSGAESFTEICAHYGIQLSTQLLPLDDVSLESYYPDLLNSFDTIIALNIASSTYPSPRVIANYSKLLTPGGYLIICKHAHTALYNGLNAGIMHWDLYNKQYLKGLLGSHFELIKKRYFNLIGIETVIGDASAVSLQESTYYNVVPLFQLTDETADLRSGLFILAVAKKK